MKYTDSVWPEPWRIPKDLNFVKERWDDYPRGGFLEDVILYQKGYETTNFLSFWAGVHYISSLIMRDSELVWAHGGMYPNFYTIMVAPPGLVKKSTTIHGLEKVETLAKSLYKNPVQQFRKAGVIIRGKATPEAIFASLANEKISIEVGLDADGDPIFQTEEKNANLIIRVSELSTFLSSAKYNVALVDKLTDFYDCKDTDSDTTIGRGNIELKNVFCTMMGATTPDTLASTIPKEAFGGGFISRSLILKEDYTERIFPEPVAWPGLPSTEELAERLAWIGHYRRGQFTLSKKAYQFYSEWYTKEKLALRESFINGTMSHENNRKDIHTLKLAHILSLQKYDITTVISLEDIKFALRIIEYTIGKGASILEESGTDKVVQEKNHVKKLIERKGEVSRKETISYVSRQGITAADITTIVDNLMQEGLVRVELDGKVKHMPSRNKDEMYIWI